MNYLELIESRESIRDFHSRPVEKNRLEEIESFFDAAPRLCPQIRVKLLIANNDDTAKRLAGVVGYRGNAFNAPSYIILLSENSEHYLENAGFIAENIILKLEDIGLCACFLTADDSDMVKKVLLIDSELTVATVIAFGYGKKERELTRLGINSPSNVNINIRARHIAPKISTNDLAFDTEFGKPMDFSEETCDPFIADALYAASLSPSFLNHQNYRFVIFGSHIYLLNKQDNMVGMNDNLLGLGAAMFNFYIILSSNFSGIANWDMKIPPGIRFDFKQPEDYKVVAHLDL